MIKRCHGKRSCSIYASTYEFGDPCYPGIQKHLNVIYTCGESQRKLSMGYAFDEQQYVKNENSYKCT